MKKAPERELLRRRSLALLGLGILVLAGTYQIVQARVSQPDFHEWAESKAEALLETGVQFGELRYRPPVGLSLQDLEIGPFPPSVGFSVTRIRSLIVGFGLVNLLRGRGEVPSRVILDRPEIHFTSFHSPFPFLNQSGHPKPAFPATLEIRQGVFRYPWRENQELRLSQVNLRTKPTFRGQIELVLQARLEGVAEGRLEVKGTTDPEFKDYQLEVRLKAVKFRRESGIPLAEVDGRIEASDETLATAGLSSLFHDWKLEWKGTVQNWQGRPNVNLEIRHEKGRTPFGVLVEMNFVDQKMSGVGSWAGRSYPFQGTLRREGDRFLFPVLRLPHGYEGNAELNLETGDYRLGIHRERRRLAIHSNWNRLGFQTEFQLDHVSIQHLDTVVQGRARFAPKPLQAGEKKRRFEARLHTGYFIVESEPLADFQGRFELSRKGLEDIHFGWGGVFALEGRILFKGGEAREDLVLRVDGFPLEGIGALAGRPIPENLAGRLEGKLKIRGEPERPEVRGYFTIKDGRIEKLDFDLAVIQFDGYPPYLALRDSKIFRGRNTLKLLGAIDLRLENVFHGIQIKGPDHLVIWRGMSMGWREGGGLIEAEKPLGEKVTLGIKLGPDGGKGKGDEGAEGQALVGPNVKF